MVIKLNIVRLNCASLNHASLNGVGERLRASAGGGGGEVIPPDIPVTYTLNASVENGSVKATVNGVAVTLPYTANEGEVVVVEVTANDGYEFDGWSDGNKSNPRTIIVNEDITLNASCKEVFVPLPTYTLSASVVNGVISATLNGKAISLPYETNEGDVIVLSVTPNDGYAFDGWNDGNTDNPRTITMTADVALSAQCVEVVVPPSKEYIQFEDKAVEAICVANWSSDGIGLTEEDAAAVTSIGTTFKGNTEITSFDELRYFTGVTFLGISTNQTAGGAFNGCTSLRSIKLPSSVTHLRPGAFNNCTSLRSVGDLSNVTRIDIYAFAGTPLEGEISLASAEGEIGYSSFTKTNITKIVSLGNATIIGGSTKSNTGAFAECGLLQSVELPSSLTEIRNWAFYKCTSLEIVICRATTPPTLANANAFSNTNNCPIYVPDASLEAYKTATNWNTYADRIHPLSEIEDYYVSDALLMHLDGINKGNVEGEWQDLVSGNTFVNHGAVAEADGWRFDGASSYMDSATLGTIGWWNKERTLEVVVKFDDISSSRTEVVYLSRKNCMAFGRYKSEHFVNSSGLHIPSIQIQSDNGKVIYGYCGNSTSYVRSVINGQQGVASYGNAFSGFLETTAFLGKRASNGDYFKGKIHAIRIHDRILSEEEILYNQRIDNKRFNLGLDI